eukprot:1143660-Pelagomonas_calceolata.AAC.3
MAERPGSSALRACKKQAHSWGAASSQGADREVLCWHDLQQAATAEQDKQRWRDGGRMSRDREPVLKRHENAEVRKFCFFLADLINP